jgi:hypothetical protein
MARIWKCLAIIFGVLLISVSSGLGYSYAKTSGDLGNTRNDLATTQASLTLTQNELNDTQNTLLDTQTELQSTKNTLANTQDNLNTTQTLLTNTKNELTDTENIFSEREAQYKEQLANAQLQYYNLSQGYGYYTNNVTYQTVTMFLEKDQTDKNPYNLIKYNCFNYSADVKNNATNEHIRCGLVYIMFKGGIYAHAIVAFSTTDVGVIFFEPQSDNSVKLELGKRYYTECLTPPSPPGPTNYDDTVESFVIIW